MTEADRRRRHGRRNTDHGTSPGTRWNDLHRPARVLVFLLILLTLIQVYRDANFIVSRVFSVLLLFVFAAIIAMLVDPVVDALTEFPPLRSRRPLAVLVVNLLLLLFVGLLIALLIPSVMAQGSDFAKQVPLLFTQVQGYVNGWQGVLNRYGIPVHIGMPSDLSTVVGSALGSAVSVVTGAVGAAVNLLLILVISVYLQIQGRELIAALRQLFPDQQELFDFSVVTAGSTLAAYVRGQVIMAGLLSIYTGVTLSLIGVHYSLVIAVITFFLELIPLIGAPVVMVLCVVIAYSQSPVLGGVTIALTVGGHIVGAYTIGLRVIGRATRVHPLVALAALLIGAELGGVLGALFATPLAGILNVYLGALYRTRRGEQGFALPEEGAVTLDHLPGLGDEISQMAEHGEVVADPVPHVPKTPPKRTRRARRPTGAG